MPIYQYRCDACGTEREEFRSVAERHDSPTCHGHRMGIVICPPAVQADLPGYVSPASGKWIEGRAARRADLKASGCRPWEGIEQERKEARKRSAEAETRSDAKLESAIRTAYHQLPPAKRRTLETPQ